MSSKRKSTSDIVAKALLVWNDSPVHVKALANSFAGPAISALSAINIELQEKSAEIDELRIALADLQAKIEGKYHGN